MAEPMAAAPQFRHQYRRPRPLTADWSGDDAGAEGLRRHHPAHRGGKMKSLHRQRGVALMMAILIVALAVILATQIGFDSVLEQKRSETVLNVDQAFQVALGAEAWGA